MLPCQFPVSFGQQPIMRNIFSYQGPILSKDHFTGDIDKVSLTRFMNWIIPFFILLRHTAKLFNSLHLFFNPGLGRGFAFYRFKWIKRHIF